MTDQLASRVRNALAELAAELPPDASAAVLASGYRPRSHTPRTIVAFAGIIATAAMALAVSLLTLGTNTPRAFAGWTPTPTAPVGAQTRTAETACRSMLARMAQHASPVLSGSALTARDWHTTLIDTRGPYTLILFVAAGGRATTTCFSGRHPTHTSAGSSFGTHEPPPVPAGQVATHSSGSTTTPPDEGSKQFSWIVGRAGAGVHEVTVVLAGGTRVSATIRGGWFLAWWPGSHPLRAIQAHTARTHTNNS